MEPRYSMSGFAIAIAIGFALLVLSGFARAAAWSAVGLFVVGFVLHALYVIQRRDGRRVPRHRRRLDRYVRVQWLGASAVGLGLGLLGRRLAIEPFTDVGVLLDALVVGFFVMWLGIFISSMVDWYLILPKVSGIACPAPCERAGRERWTFVTDVWYFHRGVAPLVVIGVMVGVPTYVWAVSDDPSVQALCGIVALLLGGFVVAHQRDALDMLGYAFNTPKRVGDVVWVVEEDDAGVRRRPAYVVDIAREGSKYKWLDPDGGYTGARFDSKGDGDPLPNAELKRRRLVRGTAPPCASGCTGVNWYCRENELAHSQSAGD